MNACSQKNLVNVLNEFGKFKLPSVFVFRLNFIPRVCLKYIMWL